MESYPAVINVRRTKFEMTLEVPRRFRRDIVIRRFPVAIGAVGFATRAGEYTVRGKTRQPDWAPPDWSEKAGDIVPFVCEHCYGVGTVPVANSMVGTTCERCGGTGENPDNPFSGGFISFEDDDPDNDNEGQGFHGTKFDPELGERASHGCVRMAVDDLLFVYEKIPVGTLVRIV